VERKTVEEEGRSVRRQAPLPSRGLWADVWHFFVRRPAVPTLVRGRSPEDRGELSQRILQRIGTPVAEYGVLNIHRIGVAAPAGFVFEELRRWTAVETCWPCHLAALERVDGDMANVQVFLPGLRRALFGLRNGLPGIDFIPLFRLDLLKLQASPGPMDVDNARFLLYACHGGYPIGILAIYVRSSIAARDEVEESQVFFVVSFDFYGRKRWPGMRLVTPLWEWVHNRATANVLNRFKDLCEARFGRLTAGEPIEDSSTSP